MADTFRIADRVLHKPSGQTWIVAYADHFYNHEMMALGWPDLAALNIDDCELVELASLEECVRMLDRFAGSSDHRAQKAIELHFDEVADDVALLIEDGIASVTLIEWALRQARALKDDELFDDIFGPDESDITPISDKIVRGRKAYQDQVTGLPIATGERHRVIKEVVEGKFLTTRHCELTIWMAQFSRYPYGHHLGANMKVAGRNEFFARYLEAVSLLDFEREAA